jgi:DNA-binding FadR family transcriptional regulator
MQWVVDGRYPPGTRLPPERELAQELGTSRVSVRSAIGRLAEWGVLSARQGSGISVRPRRLWNAGALGGVISQALERGDFGTLVPLLADARSLRRWVVIDMLERAAERFAAEPPAPGVHPLDPARALIDAAWERRDDAAAFIAVDREILPAILEAARMVPSLLFVNSLAAPYLAVMRSFPLGSPVLDGYDQRQHRVIDAVERGDAATARRLATEYLDELDDRILGFLPDDVRRAL